jgi:hypothetical protein
MCRREYSMFSRDQCPRALALMVGLSLAAKRNSDAGQWFVELIGALVLRGDRSVDAATAAAPAPRDTVRTS